MDYMTFDLTGSLQVIGDYLGTDLQTHLTEEDDVGGYHPDPEYYNHRPQIRWVIGSIFGVEGEILYTIVRSLPIYTIVENGTAAGCSTSHLALALAHSKRGEEATINTVDIKPVAGDAIVVRPGQVNFLPYIQMNLDMDGLTYIETLEDESVDFIFDDSVATKDPEVQRRFTLESMRVLRPGGIKVTHDACHHLVGADVQEGHRRAGIKPIYLLTPPSDCGLAIWKKPGELPARALAGVGTKDFTGLYETWSIYELREEIARRGLDVKSRDKQTLIDALLESDDD